MSKAWLVLAFGLFVARSSNGHPFLGAELAIQTTTEAPSIATESSNTSDECKGGFSKVKVTEKKSGLAFVFTDKVNFTVDKNCLGERNTRSGSLRK